MAPASSPNCRRCCRRSRAACRSCAPATKEMSRRTPRRDDLCLWFGRSQPRDRGFGAPATQKCPKEKNKQKKEFREQTTLVGTTHRHAGGFSFKLANLKRPTQKLASPEG